MYSRSSSKSCSALNLLDSSNWNCFCTSAFFNFDLSCCSLFCFFSRFFSFSLTFATSSSWSDPISAPRYRPTVVYLQGSWIVSSQCSMLPEKPSTCLHSSVSSTGFGSRSRLSSISPYSLTTTLTDHCRSISLMVYSELPTSDRAVSCVLRRRSFFTFHGRITKLDRAFPVAAAKVLNSLPQR